MVFEVPKPSVTDLESSSERPTLAAESFFTGDDVVALEAVGSTARYEVSETLGEGGMGEVHLCRDQRIGRDVAMKVMRKDRAGKPELRARFFREVLAQGQLEHPAVVPVYDVGTDESGSLYFTMRRVNGVTLEDVLRGLKAKDESVERAFSRHKLLTAFGNACLAIHFAHMRSVFHCDLKPANIMLGDFGEVYVLDWGLAMRGAASVPGTRLEAPSSAAGSDPGAVSGTPGYMAPEQIRGEGVDARSDVFALGAVLYELLTLQPLHVGKDARELCLATLSGVVLHPSTRAPDRDIPPEIEAICVKATAVDSKDRYASARALYDDLARYLEGDRDLLLRRTMSREHAARAASLASLARAGGEGSAIARSDAMRAVSRALALDPENAGALATLFILLTEPPGELPEEAVSDMHAAERRFERVRARVGSLSFLAFLGFVPPCIMIGIRNVPAFIGLTSVWVCTAGLLFYLARRPRKDGFAPPVAPLMAFIAIGSVSLVLGPLVLVPTVAGVFALGFTMAMAPRWRWLPMIGGTLAVIVPTVLERVGVLPPSVVHHDQMMCIVPNIIGLEGGMKTVLLTANVACVVMASYFGMRFRKVLTEAQEKIHVSAWQLRQLLPRGTPASLEPPGS